MRSRDGNSTFSLSICTVVLLLLSTVLNADEYLISYRYVVKDATLYNETLLISKAMQKCKSTADASVKKALILETNSTKNLKQIISKNSEIFLNYIHKLGLYVEHKSSTINLQNTSSTILTLKTTCFKVDFNDSFVKMAPLK